MSCRRSVLVHEKSTKRYSNPDDDVAYEEERANDGSREKISEIFGEECELWKCSLFLVKFSC